MKAIQFYQRASDFDRTNALIDRALWRCCTALVTASIALSTSESSTSTSSSSSNQEGREQSFKYLFLIPRNLKLYPVAPRDARVAGEINNFEADFIDLRHYPESNYQNSEKPKAIVPDLGNVCEISFSCLFTLII